MDQGGEAADGFKDFFNSRIVLFQGGNSPNGSLLLEEKPHIIVSRSSTQDDWDGGAKVDIVCPKGEAVSITKGLDGSHGSNHETHPSIERLSRYIYFLLSIFVMSTYGESKDLLNQLFLCHARLTTPHHSLCSAFATHVQVLH